MPEQLFVYVCDSDAIFSKFIFQGDHVTVQMKTCL